MATAIDVLTEEYGRLPDLVEQCCAGLSPAQLAFKPADGANSIAWLIWHLTRVQDGHLADLAGSAQVWRSAGWQQRFGLDLPADDTGFGATADQVAALDGTDASLLQGYFADTYRRTTDILGGMTDADLDTVIDESWTPPVTVGVRLSSVLGDDLQHLGQAAYVRGLLDG